MPNSEAMQARLATIRTLANHLLSAGHSKADLQGYSEEVTGLPEFRYLHCVGTNDLDDLIAYLSLLWMGEVLTGEALAGTEQAAAWAKQCHRCRGPDGLRLGINGRYCQTCRPDVLKERRETKEQQMKAGY